MHRRLHLWAERLFDGLGTALSVRHGGRLPALAALGRGALHVQTAFPRPHGPGLLAGRRLQYLLELYDVRLPGLLHIGASLWHADPVPGQKAPDAGDPLRFYVVGHGDGRVHPVPLRLHDLRDLRQAGGTGKLPCTDRQLPAPLSRHPLQDFVL